MIYNVAIIVSCILPSMYVYILYVCLYIGEGNGTPLQHSCLGYPMDRGAWWAAVHGVAKSWTRLSDFTFTFHFHALEKEMATHSSVLAWRIPGTEEPRGLLSMGSHRVGHNWSDLAAAVAACMYIYCKACIHTHTLFLMFFPIMVYHRILNRVATQVYDTKYRLWSQEDLCSNVDCAVHSCVWHRARFWASLSINFSLWQMEIEVVLNW